MGRIDSEEAARRLARAVLADVELYNQARIDAGADMSTQVAEGRGVFQQRVQPTFHGVFEQALAQTRLAMYASNGPMLAHPPLPRAPGLAPSTRSNTGLVIGMALVALVAALVGAYLAMGRGSH